MLFLEKETTVPDPTRLAPAHPWKKTARTVIAGLLTAAVILPLAIDQAGIDLESEAWGWLAGTLAVLAAFTRIMALPQVQLVLSKLRLDHGDVEADQVLALVVPEADFRPARIVAGEKAALPTGSSLPASTTVEQLTGPTPAEAGVVGEHRRPEAGGY